MKLQKDNVLVVAVVGKDAQIVADELMAIDKNVNRFNREYRLVTTFTTRKMHKGETQCKEHVFLEEMPKYNDGEIFVDEEIDGEHYWTTETMIRQCSKNIYVMSEKGAYDLWSKVIYNADYSPSISVPEEGEHKWKWNLKVVIVCADNVNLFHHTINAIHVDITDGLSSLRDKSIKVWNQINRLSRL